MLTMKKQTTKRDRSYRVISDKRSVTTIVYLSDKTVVVTKVDNDGNVETIVNPP